MPRSQNNGVFFTNADWLGTERARSTASGVLCQTSSSLPFGDGQTKSVPPGLTACDPTPNFFCGKQRDTESNLDDFGARYFSSQWGHWMSPDWSASPTGVPYSILENPQSLNLYAYVGNDPIDGQDPTGHADLCGAKGIDCNNAQDQGGPRNPEEQKSAPAQQQSWWQKALSYFYVKTGNAQTGFGVHDVKVGPLKVDAVAEKNGKEVKQTIDGKTTTTINSQLGVKASFGGLALGVERTNQQEEGKSPQTEWVPGGAVGKFEGKNAEIGIGVGGCFLVCGQVEIGIQADKVLNAVGDAVAGYISSHIDPNTLPGQGRN